MNLTFFVQRLLQSVSLSQADILSGAGPEREDLRLGKPAAEDSVESGKRKEQRNIWCEWCVHTIGCEWERSAVLIR